MKRSLYRHLHRTLHPFGGLQGGMRVGTAVFTLPDTAVPRWSPGPDWVEMATANYWARPATGGDLVMVRTWGRDENGYTDNEVLATGLVTQFHAMMADTPHRIYSFSEPGTVHTEPIDDGHPAERYRRYHEAVATRFTGTVRQAQDDLGHPAAFVTSLLFPAVELCRDGRSWACSIRLSLSPKPDEYWSDLALAVDVLSRVARAYRVPRVALYCENPFPVTDPLWHLGWAELAARRAGRP
jgi:hypothetical protein